MGIVITAAKPSSPAIPPTPDNVLASARATGAQIIFCVPTFIEVRSVYFGSDVQRRSRSTGLVTRPQHGEVPVES